MGIEIFFGRLALGALAVLVFLMLMRPGVDIDELSSWLGTGCLFEIIPTIVFGFIITCVHYGFFNSPQVASITPSNDASFLHFLFVAELFTNGVFSLVAMVMAAFALGKSMGVGFISTVSLCGYTYLLALQ